MGLKYDIDLPLDSPERTVLHREIILKKPFLVKLYKEWYDNFLKVIPELPEGKMVELGSGGGFLKDLNKDVICSDILDLPTNDMTFSALDMPFKDGELSAIFMIDTFHHIPDSAQFLKEANRCLAPGGRIVMVEPANSAWGRFIYKNFHHEPFEPKGGWTIPSSGPMSDANGALPWIVFERDKEQFSKQFPSMEIVRIKYHTPLRYLLSGGVSFKPLVPKFSFGLIKGMEAIATGLSKHLSMFMTIDIKKKD